MAFVPFRADPDAWMRLTKDESYYEYIGGQFGHCYEEPQGNY